MNIYKSDAKFTDEAHQFLDDKRRAYPVGTEIHFSDGVVLVRIRGGFEVKRADTHR